MRLLPIRLFYLALFAGMGTFLPYLTVFFQANGLSGTQIGLLYMVQALVAIVAAPFIGRLADHARKPERVLAVGLLVAAASGLVLGAVSSVVIITIASTLMRVGSGAAMPIADGLAVNQAKEKQVSYGSIRNFGSAGWIMTAPLAGLIAQRMGMSVLFTLFAVMMTVTVLLFFRAAREQGPRELESLKHELPDPPHRTVANALGLALKNRLLVLSAIALFLHGIFRQALYRFEPIYLKNLGVELGGIGLAASIPAAIELIAMPLAGLISARRSPVFTIALGMIMSMLRVAAVALWPVPAVIFATKVIEGAAYAFETVGIVELVASQTSRSTLRTTLALFTVSLLQIIGMVGNPIAGLIFDAAGAYPLYLLSLGGSALGVIIIVGAGFRSHLTHQP